MSPNSLKMSRSSSAGRSSLSGRNALIVSTILVVLALPAIAVGLKIPSLISLSTQILIYAIAASSLNLILGYGGMVSFGHAAFFGLGGYAAAILYQNYAAGIDFLGVSLGSNSLAAMLTVALVVGAVAGALIGALSLRTRGVPFIMITLAFAQMLFFLFVSLKAYGGDDGLMMRRRGTLPFVDVGDDATFYYVCLVAAAAWFIVTAAVTRSPFGFVLSGLRQSERRIVAIGVSPYRYMLAAFVIASSGAALAGALMANALRFVSPDFMHWTKSGELMMMVILGGAGTLAGPLLGAAALVALETSLAMWTENWQFYLGGILLAIVMLYRGGLVTLLDRSGRKAS